MEPDKIRLHAEPREAHAVTETTIPLLPVSFGDALIATDPFRVPTSMRSVESLAKRALTNIKNLHPLPWKDHDDH
jgi:hypothetical protein